MIAFVFGAFVGSVLTLVVVKANDYGRRKLLEHHGEPRAPRKPTSRAEKL